MVVQTEVINCMFTIVYRSFNYAYESFINLCTVHPIRLLTGKMEQLKARQLALDTLAPAEESSSPE